MDQIQQQAGLQREELEAEIEKIREDESFLRDHLSISVKVPKRVVVITFGEVGICMSKMVNDCKHNCCFVSIRKTDVLRWSCWTAPKN